MLNEKRTSPFNNTTKAFECPLFDATPLVRLRQMVETHNEACNDFATRIHAAMSRLEENYLADALTEHSLLQDNEAAAKTAVTDAEERQRQLVNEIVALERDIVSHRQPADELNRELRNYLGHGDIQCDVKDTGYSITRNGQPATALSEGERTAIALLYFLKTLKGRDFDKSNGVIVLDDPVSSLDANALFNAFAYVKDHCKDAHQVILLTHNFGFFRAVREWFKNLRGPQKRDWQIYMLATRMDGDVRSSGLSDIDPLLRDYESEYHYLFGYIYRLAKAPAASCLEEYLPAPTIARRVLETFLAFRAPDKDSFHSRMETVTCDDTLRSRIYRFVNTHAHRDGIGDDNEDLTILSETQAVLTDVIKFIGCADQQHCDRMIAVVSPAPSPP